MELVEPEAFVRLGGEVVGERLDPLLGGAARFAEPDVICDQVAVAHPVDHGGELGRGEVVDPSKLLGGMPTSRACRT